MFVDVEITSDSFAFRADMELLNDQECQALNEAGVDYWETMELYEPHDQADISLLGYRFSPLRLDLAKIVGVQHARRLWASKKRLKGLIANDTSRMRLELSVLQYSRLCVLCAVQAEERYQPFIDELSIIAERNEAA